ncbi:dead-box ATP-dependent RNA helicase 52c [Phtheirospermum japonicum]|uniref:RNA helicase n=1 Tax=Phtheirospermum japonicum TaxID=374723 RepID=A0A830CYH3_9LAMI|nr:dead-box ATP-dependent RNA helicase 52c [Phtheirospermum japonicum]
MSRPWFTDCSSGSTLPTRRNRPAYCPPHLRAQPEITVTIPPSYHVSRGLRRNAADPSYDISRDEQDTRSVPVEATGTDIPPPATSFSEIGFSAKALKDNIRRCKYVNPTPIQRYAIPVAIAGRDLMACAQTGSGKTAAFCFPIINGIMLVKQRNKSFFDNGIRMACPMALILAPTRELACQIHDEAKKFSYQTGVRIVAVYGGAPIVQQLRNLEKGVDILVATPGRLVDMIERTKVSLMNIKYLALDEADRMLDMGFEPQVRKIVQQMEMPPPGSRQTMLFSATFPAEIQRLASDFLSNHIFLAAGKVGSSTDLIVQRVEFVPDIDKREYLVNLLRSQETNMIPAKDALTLVFVETKRGADALERWLSRKGFPSTAIHGDKVQVERERALKSFRSGHTPILVATDVAARGLDIPHVAHVINYDLPRVVDDYVHRIGRTGRAGKSGLATAFFSEKNAPLAKALVQLMQEANQEVPTWLTEYAKTSSNGCGNGRRYGGYGCTSRVDSDDYLSRFPDMAAHTVDSAESTYGDPFAAASSNINVNFPDVADSYVSDSYNNEYNWGPVVASGWD